ncbi:MAG TPA: purine-nucleoside phosphorylase [Salinivirgaceae bacterium]|nr:purine-nucleoside phosphorylase [Salinivirgaceae bacterium]
MNILDKAIDTLRRKGVDAPRVGIILGTGLGALVRDVEVITEISYSEIDGFPVSTVESHCGKFVFGVLSGQKVLIEQGRFHYYEGYSAEQIALPVRIMKLLGADTLLISNAAGALNPAFEVGSLMAISDHINFQFINTLRGKNNPLLGPRFPDMSKAYTPELVRLMQEIAKMHKLKLHSGVYASMQGPMLETAAEYRMLRLLGADAVGMSTTPEVIAAAHMGMKVAAVSVLTDECDPDNLKPVELSQIIAVATAAEQNLLILFKELIKRL